MSDLSVTDQKLDALRQLAKNWRLIAEFRSVEMERKQVEAANLLAKRETEWKIKFEALTEEMSDQVVQDPAVTRRLTEVTREMEKFKKSFIWKLYFFLRSPKKALKEFKKDKATLASK
jgi:hypothetical protein